MHRPTRLSALCASLAIGLAFTGVTADAHITLPPGGAAAGSDHAAAFRVGHACAGSSSTTGVKVRLPDGFTLLGADERPGWTLTRQDREVSWVAATPQAALPTAERASFVVRGHLTERPGTLWFKVLQTCDRGSADWAEVGAEPAAGGASGAGSTGSFPAARLDVLPPGRAPVEVRDAWARPTAAGQGGGGVFARLTAPAGSRLVGVSTPVAGVAEVHEMRMEGDVMRMRAVDAGLDLPAGQPVDLGPGGYHVMLMQLRQPLVLGSSFPLTLQFVDREGRRGSVEVPVQVRAGAQQPSAEHQHMH